MHEEVKKHESNKRPYVDERNPESHLKEFGAIVPRELLNLFVDRPHPDEAVH